MYEYKMNNQPSILNLIGTAVVVLLVLIYVMVSFSTSDPLWFWPYFNESPATVTLFCYGNPVSVDQSSASYEELTTLFNEQFSGYKNWDSLTMSENSWAEYQVND